MMVPYLENMKMPCPMYHNPADYIIELACGEYGGDKIDILITGSQNGRNLQWFDNPQALKDAKSLRGTKKVEEHKIRGVTIKSCNFIHLKIYVNKKDFSTFIYF